MSADLGYIFGRVRGIAKSALSGPHILAFVPAVTLGGYWYGGEGLVLYMALILPATLAVARLYSASEAHLDARDGVTGFVLKKAAVQRLDQHLLKEKVSGMASAVLVLGVDDFMALEQQYGTTASNEVLRQVSERLASTMRTDDLVARLDDHEFAVVLAPMRRSDLETLIQISARIQKTLSDPYSIDASSTYLSVSIGFCTTSRLPARDGSTMLECAESAYKCAQSNGAGSIRAFSPETKRVARAREELATEVAAALNTGQIVPWFQPQISTDTGAITGLEALARWDHPSRGLVAPVDFLPAMEQQNLMERLSEVMLSQSLSALREWQSDGLNIPSVSVNFSSAELRNPMICEKIRWELDRFNLAPGNLCVEILENVVASAEDDVINRNIAALADIGCKIDLDDFGTGHAAIASIRRFAINRIKIDRSFVTRVDKDRDQQSMITAILTMAERLQLETLAEGVETIGEHAMMAQLGCGYVQGFSIARPMPASDVVAWVEAHTSKTAIAPKIGKWAS